MKKSLIALTSLCAAGAFAQSSVTVFGAVDLGYESVKTNAGRISGIGPSALASSALGFRGVEDLGGGLAASFWLEAALNPASGYGPSGTTQNNQNTTIPAGGLMFNRRSTVGLSGNFGELRIGRDYTPSYWNYTFYDPFGNTSVGISLTAAGSAGAAATQVRASNSIAYFLPKSLGGFFGQVTYAIGNRASTETFSGTSPAYAVGRNTSDNGRYVGLRFGYGQGPFQTAAAYGRTTYAPGTNTVGTALGGVFPSGNYTDMSWGGSYKFGSVKALALVARNKVDDAAALGNHATFRSWGVGADWGVGASNILLSYSRVSLSSGLLATEPRATKWALGYVYNLSKRTALYGIYAHVGNSGGGAQTAMSYSAGSLGAVNGPANVNGGSTGINIGVRHAF